LQPDDRGSKIDDGHPGKPDSDPSMFDPRYSMLKPQL